ncbi:Alcohol dehydrogenase zinc-binding domain protein [Candidatus Contendobacter odensis Run_B_J11]|uniref:Alcohol dehydrogenase zinc-binding domain protein n=2 Tax=Candidatus Contendibacter odensensis TaxID=1400860 RepID=A0A7U7GCI9_9GAMM|nr:Alcohol dehydrogenase zinc-binding domain protein [Candidatus Contendobacter odensis Run_B_J11]
MTTMKAVRIHAYGGPELLHYETIPRPALNPDDLLIRVRAAAVNPVDWKIREGHLQGFLNHQLPLILGWDVSGEVVKMGPEATGFKIGDAVYARPDIERDGSYAEYIAVKASEAAHKPAKLDHDHAAAVPLAALTAWQALVDAAQLQVGQRVLIHAAAGGVGSFAVQLAKAKGAQVIATASAVNVGIVAELGVDQFVDYTRTRFEEIVKEVDVVFDTVGGDTQDRSWQVLKPGGILVSVINPPPEETAAKHGVRSAFVFVQPSGQQLTAIARLIDAGRMKPIIHTVLPLSDARQAQVISQGGHARGKIVLHVAD